MCFLLSIWPISSLMEVFRCSSDEASLDTSGMSVSIHVLRSVQGAPPCVLSQFLFVMQNTLSQQYKRRSVINAESTLKCLSRIKDTHWNSIPKWSIAVISFTYSGSYTFFPFYAAAVLPTSLDVAEKFAGVRKIPRDGLEFFASWSVKPLVYQRRFSSTGHGL